MITSGGKALKLMDQKLLEEIAQEVKRGDNHSLIGFESYDTWGDADRSNKYHQLKYHLYDKGINGFKIKDEIYIIEFTRANNIMTMGGTPDSILVKSLVLL